MTNMFRSFRTLYLFTFVSVLGFIAGLAPLAVGGFSIEPPPPGIDDQIGPATVGQLTLTAVDDPFQTTAMLVGHCGGGDVSVISNFPGFDTGSVSNDDVERARFRLTGSVLETSGFKACYKVDQSITEMWFIIYTASKVTHPAPNVVVADVIILRLIDRFISSRANH